MAGAFAVSQTTADAVDDTGLFELDANAVNDPVAQGEDWINVCPAGTPQGDAGPCLGNTTADVSAFVIDEDGASIFTGGGSKDDLDTSSWRHTAGSVPDKDELSHSYAARFRADVDPNVTGEETYLFFGADRIANNGDAQIGFWFFQSEVGPQADGSFGPGVHKDGDVLVLSDFTKGGTKPTVRVFEWNGPGGTIPGEGAIDGTLDLLFGTTEAPQDCRDPQLGANDPACATVNPGVEPSPWSFEPKNKPAGSFQPGELYEGGVNLTFLGLDDECFSSFLAETRSSQSVDAVLKDFSGGPLSSCGVDLTTEPSTHGPVTPGTIVTDTATVTGSGITNPPTPTGDVTFSVCGPVVSGTCTGTPTSLGTATLSGSGPSATATTSPGFDTTGKAPGLYCFTASYEGDDNYGAVQVESNPGNECFTIADVSALTTAQDWLPNDTATLTTTGGSNLNGSVLFELVDGAACPAQGTVLYSVAVPVTNAASGSTFSSANTTVKVTTTKSVSWRVTFTSSDSTSGSSHCENTSLTISN